MDNKTGSNHGHNVVRKCKKNTRNIGKISKHGLPFLARYGHPWTEKRSENGHFPRRIVFTFPLGFADVFGRRSYPKHQKTPFLTPGPNPKVLIMRVEKGPHQRNTRYETIASRAPRSLNPIPMLVPHMSEKRQ